MVLKEAGSECEAAGREAVVKRGEQRLMLWQVLGLGGIVGLNKDKQKLLFHLSYLLLVSMILEIVWHII